MDTQYPTFVFFWYKQVQIQFDGVLQECRGYGYVDMMQMKKLCHRFI